MEKIHVLGSKNSKLYSEKLKFNNYLLFFKVHNSSSGRPLWLVAPGIKKLLRRCSQETAVTREPMNVKDKPRRNTHTRGSSVSIAATIPDQLSHSRGSIFGRGT